MKRVLTPVDVSFKDDFNEYLRPFVWVRSFAVNTMRHGAPMEIEF